MRLRHFVSVSLLACAAVSARADVKFITNSCTLLSEQEVSAVVGTPAKIGMRMDAAGICMFNNAKSLPVFSVRGFIYENVQDSTENYNALVRVAPPKGVEVLSGIGDRAEIITTAGGDIMLYILKQNRLISLSLMHGATPDPGARKPALTQAAKQAAARF